MIKMQWVVAVALCTGMVAAQGEEPARMARYTQVTGSDPAEMNPLAVVVQVHFPREVVTSVGDALDYLLGRTGYTLKAVDSDAKHLLELPLPEAQRTLGPRKVEFLVRALVGDAYGLCINDRSRELGIAAIDGNAECLANQLRGE